MKNQILTLQETAALIEAGEILAVAGPDALLSRLPAGKWIGGSAAFAVTETGTQALTDRLHVTTFPEALGAVLRHVPTERMETLAAGYLPEGVTVAVIPGFSTAHKEFAAKAASYTGLFNQPLIGWVAAVAPEEIGRATPAAFDGALGKRVTDGVLLMHILTEGTVTALDIVNPFLPSDNPATTFRFAQSGFTVTEAIVGDRTVPLAAYLIERGIDTRLPLITEQAGARVNLSFRSVDPEAGTVSFLAPVMAGAVYRLARPLADPAAAFAGPGGEGFACHGIGAHLGEGSFRGTPSGPVTFGEIAYILLNQTSVRLSLHA
jgi:hypothetical protein